MLPGTFNSHVVAASGDTIVDIDYADGTSGTHDLAVSDLVLTYTDPEAHKVTPRASISVDIDLWGAGGGWGNNESATTASGSGAKVSITSYTMTANEYQFLIGQGGQRGSSASLAGGFPDGGDHSATPFGSEIRGTGGGSTRFALSSDLVDNGLNLADWNDALSDYLGIAAGGGGAASGYGGAGGAGGATTGVDGSDGGGGADDGGHGGTQSAGGAGQAGRSGSGQDGAKYAGGDGSTTAGGASGGTGGGGLYGGASGSGYYGGGGGGSSFLDAGLTGTKTSGSAETAPSGQPASYPNAGDGNSLAVGYNGVAVISLA